MTTEIVITSITPINSPVTSEVATTQVVFVEGMNLTHYLWELLDVPDYRVETEKYLKVDAASNLVWGEATNIVAGDGIDIVEVGADDVVSVDLKDNSGLSIDSGQVRVSVDSLPPRDPTDVSTHFLITEHPDGTIHKMSTDQLIAGLPRAYEVRGTVTLDSNAATGTVHDTLLGDSVIDATTLPTGAAAGWVYTVDSDATNNSVTGTSIDYHAGMLLFVTPTSTNVWMAADQGVSSFNNRNGSVVPLVGDYATWYQRKDQAETMPFEQTFGDDVNIDGGVVIGSGTNPTMKITNQQNSDQGLEFTNGGETKIAGDGTFTILPNGLSDATGAIGITGAGHIIAPVAPVDDNHLINKKYADDLDEATNLRVDDNESDIEDIVDGTTVVPKAADADTLDGLQGIEYMAIARDEIVTGDKTFTGIVNVDVPTTNSNPATKFYVDTLDDENVKLTGDQTVTGVKTFQNSIEVGTGTTAGTISHEAYSTSVTLGQNISLQGDSGADVLLTGSHIVNQKADGQVKVTSTAPISDEDLTRKDYVDTLDDENVKITGDQDIAGIKTFTDKIEADVVDVNNQLQLPVSDIPTGNQADMRFNSTSGKFEGHNGTKWGSIGGGGAGTPRTVTTDAAIDIGEYIIFDAESATGDVTFTLPDSSASTEDFFTVGFRGTADYKITLTSTRDIMETGNTTFEFQNNFGNFAFVLDDNDMWRISSAVGESEAPQAIRSKIANYYPAGVDTFPIMYDLGFVDVYINGFKMPSDEYTAVDETTVVLNNPLIVESFVEVIAWQHSEVTGLPLPFLNALHPVGSVVLRMDAVDPSSLYGGTWALITGDAALSFGNGAVQSGTPTGANTNVVPIPEHSHTGSVANSVASTVSTVGAGGHDHGLYTNGDSNTSNGGQASASRATSTRYTIRTHSVGNHSHSVTIPAHSHSLTVNNTGTAGASMDVRGARISINVWQRTA